MINNDGRLTSPAAWVKTLLLIAGPLLLPLLGAELAWMHALIPLTVAYHLVLLGRRQGNTLVIQALALSGVAALFSQATVLFLFGVTMVPLGYIMADAIRRGDSPTWTGLKGLAYLAVLWLLLGAYASISGAPTPLQLVRESIDQGLAAALEQQGYSVWEGADGAMEGEFTQIFKELRSFIDRAWLGLFAISLLSLVWFNLLTSHWLLKRKELSPWSELRQWRLPDHFVAAAALALLLLLLRFEPLATIGLNVALVMGMLYFMQGLGVMSFLMARWNFPPLLRGVCYALVLLQGYGLLLLALLGLAEVRLNLRRRPLEST